MSPSAQQNPNLKNKSVFKHQKTVMGIPDTVFVAALLIALFGVGIMFKLTGWIVGSVLSIAWLALIFIPLQSIHSNDAQAWRIWLRMWRHPGTLTATYTEPKKLIVLHGNDALPLHTFTKKRKQQ